MNGELCAAGGVRPEPIHTPRLALVPMPSQLVLAIVGQDWAAAQRLLGTPFPREWHDDGWHWLEPQATNGRFDDRFIAWGTRLALPLTPDVGLPHRGPVLAEIGFHGPPDPAGWVEIGYRVVAEHRRRGLAEEATSALLMWATAHGATGVKASVSPGNTASIGLLNKLGFAASGLHRHDVLGEQLVFCRINDAPH